MRLKGEDPVILHEVKERNEGGKKGLLPVFLLFVDNKEHFLYSKICFFA